MIYYFSATGNSQHVATRIAEALGTASDKFYSTLRGFIIASLSAQLKFEE